MTSTVDTLPSGEISFRNAHGVPPRSTSSVPATAWRSASAIAHSTAQPTTEPGRMSSNLIVTPGAGHLAGLRFQHVRPSRHGGRYALGRRERQDETAVVVSVLADQVDPAGCAPHPVGRTAVAPGERCGDVHAASFGRDVPIFTSLVQRCKDGKKGLPFDAPGTRGHREAPCMAVTLKDVATLRSTRTQPSKWEFRVLKGSRGLRFGTQNSRKAAQLSRDEPRVVIM
jgi:hypothetical protein